MALDEAPPFWWDNPGWQAWLLSPLGFAYGRASAKRMGFAPTLAVNIPVICVGNFITGGAGKTPTASMLAKHARARGMRPGILSRGFGGAITKATVVNTDKHNAHDVGDEPLVHATQAVTVISADRAKGAQLLCDQGCNIIIMDDGFQNPALLKDYSLIVVDAKRGIGNGFAMPAGPMRVPLKKQIPHVDGVLVIGDGERGVDVIRQSARAGKPVFTATLKVIGKTRLAKLEALAFAGISDPSKFFDTLENIGVRIKAKQGFGDHHLFTDEECSELLKRAKKQKLSLLTTTKDLARLTGMGKLQQKLADACTVVHTELVPDDPTMLSRIFDAATGNATARKLQTGKSG